MNELLRNDIELKLNIKLSNCNVHYYTDGATDAVVFSIDNKYLIKTCDEITLKNQVLFLNTYQEEYFQKIIYYNEELGYICFSYIEGEKLKEIINPTNIIKQLHLITSKYKPFNYEGYGYIYDDIDKSWSEFLENEVIYSKIEIEDVNNDKVLKSIEIIKDYQVDKYLIHGDFGTHNFLLNKENIYVIDPMGVAGDPLYDFYFAIFSNFQIFSSVSIPDILKYYEHDINYKKALMIIVIYIRLSRAHKYDQDNYYKYLELYEEM